MEFEEIGKISGIEIGGKITVEKVSVHRFDDETGSIWHECRMIIDVKMEWNEDVTINHKARLQWKLKKEEVEQLQEKGLIKIKRNGN